MTNKVLDQYNKLKRLDVLKRNYALFFYKPYPKQREFHDAGATFRERLLMAGNQLGKCIVIGSLIDTPKGQVRVESLLEGDEVFAWANGEKVRAQVHAPFRKDGLHKCYRILMSDGRWVDCADRHRLLTFEGWRYVESLLPSGVSHQQTSAEFARQAHVSDVLRLTKKAASFAGHYCQDFHRYGAQLLAVVGTLQSHLPSLADALRHNQLSSHVDALGSICTNNAQADSVLLSSLGVLRRCVGRFVGFAVQASYRFSARNLPTPLASRLLSIVAGSLLRSVGGFDFRVRDVSVAQSEPWSTPDIDGNHIIAIIPIGRHKVYDFTVPRYHNYCAAGLVHHNTLAAGHEVVFHITGLYPDWWAGKILGSASRGWVAGLTSEMTRDGAQRILLGPIGQWGTGCIPKELILEIKRARGVPDAVESILVRHVPSNGISQITFKAYSDGREAFQSETLDWFWLDEEPPYDIYTEGLTRTNKTTGPVFLTFTPLLGMSNVVCRFLNENRPDCNVTGMTIDDVDHYDEEQKKKIIAQYPAHELEARTRGIPMLGSGRIFPIADEVLREDPIGEIPKTWLQIIGMDFGWDHPTAAIRLAYDPQNDVIHIISSYRQSETTPVIHANAIKPWGEWVPVAWPHDALQHDKSGEQYRRLYADQGLNMLSTHAAYDDKRNNGVEEGLMDMLQRMQTGRFKIDRTLNQWWEEFHMYHRKDGKVIKDRDDLMSATRYAVMMLRYAQPAESAPARPDRYATHGFTDAATWMSA